MSADDEKRAYEHHWSRNAGDLAMQGCYEWMAAQLDELNPKRVLDVGCGTGSGLLALRQRFNCQLLSIDENPHCLRSAAALLRKNGAKVQMKLRYQHVDQPHGRHAIGVVPGEISLCREVILLQGDPLLADERMFDFLYSQPKFDAVTIWLIGTIQMRRDCINLDDFKMVDLADYRCHVQNKVYELAARVLRPGGLLQVVDRGNTADDPALREELLRSHREQAFVTDLEVLSIVCRPYNELTGGRGVQVVMESPSTAVKRPVHFVQGLLCVLSRKPNSSLRP